MAGDDVKEKRPHNNNRYGFSSPNTHPAAIGSSAAPLSEARRRLLPSLRHLNSVECSTGLQDMCGCPGCSVHRNGGSPWLMQSVDFQRSSSFNRAYTDEAQEEFRCFETLVGDKFHSIASLEYDVEAARIGYKHYYYVI